MLFSKCQMKLSKCHMMICLMPFSKCQMLLLKCQITFSKCQMLLLKCQITFSKCQKLVTSLFEATLKDGQKTCSSGTLKTSERVHARGNKSNFTFKSEYSNWNPDNIFSPLHITAKSLSFCLRGNEKVLKENFGLAEVDRNDDSFYILLPTMW